MQFQFIFIFYPLIFCFRGAFIAFAMFALNRREWMKHFCYNGSNFVEYLHFCIKRRWQYWITSREQVQRQIKKIGQVWHLLLWKKCFKVWYFRSINIGLQSCYSYLIPLYYMSLSESTQRGMLIIVVHVLNLFWILEQLCTDPKQIYEINSTFSLSCFLTLFLPHSRISLWRGIG